MGHFGRCSVAMGVLTGLMFSGCAARDASRPVQFEVRQLPDVPQALGGTFSGLLDGTLVVAGGSYFVAPPPSGKTWVGDVWALVPGAQAWTVAGRLPTPLAYGAAVCVPGSLLLAGGCDAERHFDSVSLLSMEAKGVRYKSLMPLPQAAAYMNGALLGNCVYVAGGRAAPDASQAMHTFWMLDLERAEMGWQVLEPWPGPARMLACVLAQAGAVYVISGAELLPAPEGPPVRRYLTDAYRYRPGQGWSRVADLPHATVAAPAVAWGTRHLLVFGGDDGRLAAHGATLGDAHPGFRRELLAYDTSADTWATIQHLPPVPVTTHASASSDAVIIPTGENRPGQRTPAVLAFEPHATR